MSRVAQPPGSRGSLKWIQRAVNGRADLLDGAILARIPGAASVSWLSPLESDDFAEYRDADFLDLVGAGDAAPALATFWPRSGPQWDALGKTDTGDILLVEAKAHVGEILSPATGATGAALVSIEAALSRTVERVKAQPKAQWSQCFYQYANRLAHLAFLREHGYPVWLVLVSFLGDADMGGPTHPETWSAAYSVMDHVLGLRARHGLSRWIVHVHPSVAELV